MDLLSAAILSELECPVCTDYMHPPIRQCVVGHSFCDKCYEKLANCPTCRNPKGTARSYALENLHQKISFPCRNQIVGCTTVMSGTSIKRHEEICPYAPLDCPLKVIDNCAWRGHLSDVIAHCKDKHPANVYLTAEQTLTCKSFANRDETLRSYHIMFRAYDEIFKATLQIDYASDLMRWCVYHLASYTDESAAKYSYGISIDDGGNRSGTKKTVSLRSSCQPIKPIEETFANDSCMLTHCDMIRRFCVDDDFIYTINIYKNQAAADGGDP